jgi:hypothetical protein
MRRPRRALTSFALLHGQLALHDVVDVEKFCGRILDDQLRAFGIRLRSHDDEDAVAYLIGQTWELSLRYDPAHGQSFSKFARAQLRLRVVDWLRKKLGRTNWSQSDRGVVKRARREVLSLDRFVDETRELDGGIGAGTLDSPRGCDPTLGRLLED